jgi:GntR family transcriptional regulator/MocR family aminotransferase
MARLKTGIGLPFLKIEKSVSVPIYKQIENQIRSAILAGTVKPEMQMPSSRVLAHELKVSRPTIVQAYEYLTFEGFLESRHGAGTFVRQMLPDHLPEPGTQHQKANSPQVSVTKPLSDIGAKFANLVPSSYRTQFSAFLPNLPAYDQFPFAQWQKIRNRCIRQGKANMLGYEDSAGSIALRTSIAKYLAIHRGDICDPAQILIVPGATFAMHLAVTLLSNPGDKVWLEDPGPDGMRMILKALNRTVANLDVEPDGMDVDTGIRDHGDARLALTMPSRHHPLGVSLSLAKRLKILNWAQHNGSWIIEDDYDSEFRYSGRPLASMHSIDTTNSVIYIGTFSKSMFPSMRIGYFVVPESLIGVFRSAIASFTRSISILDQETLAHFIDEGYFSAHIRQMQNTYGARRKLFAERATHILPDLMHIDIPDSGMNAIGWLPPGTDDALISERARQAGAYSFPLSLYRERPSERSGLLLGFAGVREDVLDEKLTCLARVLEQSGLG